jgi:hypothetical protein
MHSCIARGPSLGLLGSWVVWILRASAPAAAAPTTTGERPLAALFPPHTAVFVSMDGLADLLRAGDTHPTWKAFEESALGKVARPLLEERLDHGLSQLQEYAGTDWRATYSALVEQGAALGIARCSGRPGWAMVLRSRDETALEAARLKAFEALGKQFGMPKLRDLPSATVRGARVWQLGPDFALAVRGDHLIAGNVREYVDEIVANLADAGALGLLVEPALAEAWAEGGDKADLFVWADRERTTLYEQGESARGELEAQERAARDPSATLLLGPALGLTPAARSYSARLNFAEEDPRLMLRAHEVEIDSELLSRPAAASRLERGPADLLHATLHRDFAALLARRTTLFDPEHLAGMAKGISDLSLFFMGKDLVEEVLPAVSSGWTLVSRPIDWGVVPRPQQELPAIAAMVDLANPDRDGPQFVAAFQSLVSILNVERAQQGEDAMVLELALEGSTQLSCAYFVAPPAGEPVDMRYNLAPAIARVGPTLVLATHCSLARQLVRELAGAAERGTAGLAGAGSGGDVELDDLRLDGPGLARVIAANTDALVANAMLSEGKPEAVARRELEILRLISEFVQSARFDLRRAGADTELRIEIDLPSPAPGAAR